MQTKQQLETALKNADQAGDVAAAKQLANALKSGQYNLSPTVEKQRVRSLVQGATLGFGDEIEAAARTFQPVGRTASNQGRYNDNQNYTNARDDIRNKLTAYQDAHPYESMAYEFGGAGANALLTKSPAGFGRIVGRGAVEGGIAGLGYSEDNMATDTAEGSVIGGGIAGFGNLGGRLSGKLTNTVVDAARKTFGDSYTNRVQNYLRQAAQQTGLTEDELIAKVASGDTLSDDLQMTQTIKFLVSKGGFTQKEIQDLAKGRMQKTRDTALSDMQQAVAPDIEGGNIFAGVKNNFDNLKQQESADYNRLFKDTNPAVDDSTAKQMLAIVQRSPSSGKAAQDLAQMENIVPFYTVRDNGAIDFVRQPTLQDAELLLRAVKDEADASFRLGQGAKGSSFKSLANTLQKSVDEFSPDLQETRAKSALRFSGKDAYELGRGKAFTINPDELSTIVADMNPTQLKNLRAGYLEGIKNKAFKKGSALADAANEDLSQGLTAKIILGPDAEPLIAKMQRAANARRTSQIANPLSGSPTAPQLQQEKMMQASVGAADLGQNLAQGNFAGATMAAMRLLAKRMPELDDAERMQVTKALFSEDPEFVQKMLSGEIDTTSAAFARRINQALTKGGDVVRQGSIQQQQQL